ncbi:hypothetical protein J2W51_002345 [Tardiphaga robiniae]|uniref:hypothetical protein n=1 Tax=Tardiphaga robiniae TaxID=943830 RepID=UPI0028649417|nr:hypothetical protein [Tardiphaga robiniae]MDR6659775.1 hypothetical protein [Tardiphaga robiniae]
MYGLEQLSILNMTNQFDLPTLPNAPLSERARMSDEQSLIKARYCRSILKVAAISTEQEARGLLESLATEQLTPNTSAPMAEAERTALAAIRDLTGFQRGRSVPQSSSEWMRAARAIQLWLNIHD